MPCVSFTPNRQKKDEERCRHKKWVFLNGHQIELVAHAHARTRHVMHTHGLAQKYTTHTDKFWYMLHTRTRTCMHTNTGWRQQICAVRRCRMLDAVRWGEKNLCLFGNMFAWQYVCMTICLHEFVRTCVCIYTSVPGKIQHSTCPLTHASYPLHLVFVSFVSFLCF